MSELKACLFCGKNQLESPDDCVCNEPDLQAMTAKDWNNRPIEDALNKRITKLEATVEKLNGWVDELINAGNQPRHLNWQDNWDAIVYRILTEREKC